MEYFVVLKFSFEILWKVSNLVGNTNNLECKYFYRAGIEFPTIMRLRRHLVAGFCSNFLICNLIHYSNIKYVFCKSTMNDINNTLPHDQALWLRILPAVVYLSIAANIFTHMDETTQLTSLKHCCCAILTLTLIY